MAIAAVVVISISAILARRWRQRDMKSSTKKVIKTAATKGNADALPATAAAVCQKAKVLHSHFASYIGESVRQGCSQLFASRHRSPQFESGVELALAPQLCKSSQVSVQSLERLEAHPAIPDAICLAISGPHDQPLLERCLAVDRACAELFFAAPTSSLPAW